MATGHSIHPDLADATDTPPPGAGVYFMLEASVVVYIGSGRDPRRRPVAHAKAGITFDAVLYLPASEDRPARLALERHWVRTLRPKHNTRYNPDKARPASGNRRGGTANGKRGGLRTRPEFGVWWSMLSRCYRANTKSYPDYGAKGVRVCDRWRESFANFFADMGPRPSDGHSLDRYPNLAGDYCPENCRWATQDEQSRHRSDNRLMTLGGKTKTMTDWCAELGLKVGTVWGRLSRGASEEEALSTTKGGRLRKNWSHVTDDELCEARHRLGSWRLAGREFGMGKPAVHMRVRYRRLNGKYESIYGVKIGSDNYREVPGKKKAGGIIAPG